MFWRRVDASGQAREVADAAREVVAGANAARRGPAHLVATE
jgi:hypothetical protein